jgi:hypothetical protein
MNSKFERMKDVRCKAQNEILGTVDVSKEKKAGKGK